MNASSAFRNSDGSVNSGETTSMSSNQENSVDTSQSLSREDEIEAEYRSLVDVEGERHRKRRLSLPVFKGRHSFSLWSFAKSLIGRDLTRITMPVHFNEPLSFTQRICEDLEYAEILHKAHECDSRLDRIAHIAAFACSCFASAEGRFWKPFNPLLGETFELIQEDCQYAVVCEQVCHHPPVTAMHCEAENWSLWQEYKLDIRFRGQYIKVIPTGIVHLRMKSDNLHYSWKKPTTTIHNIILGRLWVDNEGEVVVTCHQTKETASVRFQSYSKAGKSFKDLKGEVRSSPGNVERLLRGAWDKGLDSYKVKSILPKNNYECGAHVHSLWRIKERPVESPKMYGFTNFTMGLNDIDIGVCSTDSRMRPDIRLLELGHVDDAVKEKHRLEEKQRAARRSRDAAKATWKPRDANTGIVAHVYSGGYWKAKMASNFENVPDIY